MRSRDYPPVYAGILRSLLLLTFGIVTASCSRLDREGNCLNDKAGCFKADRTAPSFVTSTPLPAATVSRLTTLTVVFSEELKDPKPADIFITGVGKGQLTLASITKSAANTYTLQFSPDTVANGNILIDFTNLTDYNNNKLNYALALTGNVDIEIQFDESLVSNSGYRKGVSNGGGYTTTAIKWTHSYTDDPGNNWDMRVTSGAVDCSAGTSFFTGTGLAAGASVTQTFDRLTHFAAGAGSYRIVVCITNAAMNKKGVGSLLIVRDDTPPTAIYSPVSDDYNATKTMTVSCSDNPDKVAIQQAQMSPWDGNIANPANPADPDFDTSGAVSAGTLLAAGHPITNPTNPTRTKVRYRCIDIAGNKSIVGMATYLVDTTLPEVAVNLDTSFRQFVSVTGYTTTTLNFTTNQSGTQYRIVKNATSCAALDGTSVIGAGPFTTPPAGPHVINASALDVGVNNIRVCVANVGATKWGAASLQITRDDTVPFVTPSVTTGTYGAVQVVNLTCSPNADKVVITSATLAGASAPTPPLDPNIDTNGNILFGVQQDQFTTPDASVSTIKWQCITRSGNRSVVDGTSTATYTVDAILPTVTVVSNTRNFVSNLAGAFNFTDLTFQVSRANLNYSIKSGSANCTGGTTLDSGTVITAGQDITIRLNTPIAGPPTHFSNVGGYDLKICVPNFIGALGYSTTSLGITRDDSPPATVTGLTVTAATTTSVTLGWTAATDPGASASGVGGYRIYQRTSAGAYVPTTFYTSNTNSVNISGLSPTETYHFVVRAVDNAGNVATTDSNEVQSRFALSVTVAGYSSALNGPFRVQLGAGEILSFTANGTQTFSQVFLSGDTYTLPIIAQPATQNCAFVGNQYGTMTASATLQVTCVSGYSSGGGLIVNKPAPLNYLLYRGNATIIAGGGNTGSMCPGAVSTTCYDGTGTNAQFANPHGMTIVGGTIYVADRSNNRIRSIDTTVSPVVTATFAGDGSAASGDSTNRLTARFNAPQAISTDGANLFVVESPAVVGQTGYLRKINIATGNVTTLAGGGTGGTPCPGSSQPDCTDGTGAQTRFNGANGIVYHDGFLYITEFSNNRVRRMNLATGVVDTIAGDGATTSGADNVSGTSTSFNGATGAAVVGNQLYVADFNGHRIRAVSLTAPFTVTAVTGTGTAGHADGPLASARFYNPDHLTTDGYNLFVTEYGGDGQTGRRLRRIDLRKGRVSTIAGNSLGTEAAGIGAAAAFGGPVGVVSDGRQLFVAAYDSGRIFRVTDSGLVGYWPLHGAVNDYASDVTTLQNGSIQDSDFTATLVPTTGRYGESSGAYVFDGNNDVISANATNLPTGNSTRTLCAWVKFNGPQSGNDGIVGYGRRGVTDNAFGLAAQTGLDLKLFVHSNDTPFNRPVENAIWSHACILREASTGQIRSYLNGKLIAYNMNSLATPVGSKLCIGSRVNSVVTSCSPDFFFAGSVADVRVYNRSLSEGEINELAQDASSDMAITGSGFNNGATGLLAHYEFNVSASLAPSGPIGGNLAAPGSQPIGVHGDAGGAFYYDGSTNNSSSGYGLPSGNSARTLCIWIKPQISQSNRVLVAHGTAALNRGFGMSLETNAVSLWSYGNSVSLYTYTPQLNTWQHLCGTFEGGNGRIYANGVLLGTQVLAGTLDTAGDQLAVGSNLGGGNIYQGTIDDVRVYNSALTDLQVRQLAAQVPAGLVRLYDMTDDLVDAKARDSSGWGVNTGGNAAAQVQNRLMASLQSYNFSTNTHSFSGSDAGLPAGSASRTLCAWVRPTAYPASTWGFIAQYGTQSDGSMFGLAIKSANSVTLSGYNSDFDVTYNYPLHVWTHICGTYNGTTAQIFVNGASMGSGLRTWNTVLQGNPGLYIGRAGYDQNQRLTGDIDDVRIYNRVLSAAELRVLAGYHPMQVSTWNATPASSSMKLHYVPEQLGPLANNADITQWDDISGHSMHLFQGTPGSRPQYALSGINNRPAVNFISNRIFTRGCNDTNLGGDNTTIISAIRQTSNSGANKGLFEYGQKLIYLNGGASQTLSYVRLAPDEVKITSLPDFINLIAPNPNMIYAVSHSLAGGAIYKNGSNVTSGTPAVSASQVCSTGLYFGGRNGYDNFEGLFGDFLYFNTILSSADRRIAECYLSSKYSVPLDNSVICD
ncbi:MAG: LamG-like jellyroll fold domain-containing protein [Spirochaetota bacterium]